MVPLRAKSNTHSLPLMSILKFLLFGCFFALETKTWSYACVALCASEFSTHDRKMCDRSLLLENFRASSQTLCVGKPDGKSPMEPKHGRNFRQQAPIAHFSSESPTVCTRHKCSNMVTFNEGTTFSNILLHLEAPLFSFILWSSCWILLLIPLWRLLFVDGHFM
ncbi:hypothetical protein AB205_0110800, partial [Aquarana catesbeiana]